MASLTLDDRRDLRGDNLSNRVTMAGGLLLAGDSQQGGRRSTIELTAAPEWAAMSLSRLAVTSAKWSGSAPSRFNHGAGEGYSGDVRDAF
jgi:hypothetical protein